MEDGELVEIARNHYALGSSNDIEIDEDVQLSRASDGAWVRAWVWVPFEDEDEPVICETCGDLRANCTGDEGDEE